MLLETPSCLLGNHMDGEGQGAQPMQNCSPAFLQMFKYPSVSGTQSGGGLGGFGMGQTPEVLAAMRRQVSEAPFYASTHNLTPLGANIRTSIALYA